MAELNDNPNRWGRVYEALSGASSGTSLHYDAPTGTAPESITAGHEPDRFDTRGIIMVPVLVIAVTFGAYLLVSGAFRVLAPGKPVLTPTMSPLATADSTTPYNERVDRISSTDAKARFHQPRLEYVKNIENKRPGEKNPDPPFLRSFVASPEENTYELKPQDLYPALFVDPKTKERLLDEYKWLNKDKHVARIPVDEAMKLLVASGQLKAKKDGVAPQGTAGRANVANGGIAIAAPVVQAAPEAVPAKSLGH